MNNKKLAKEIVIDTLKGGFAVVLPTFGMIYIIYLIVSFTISLMSPITNFLTKFLNFPDLLVTSISFFLFLSICFLCGVLLKTKFGKFSYFIYEKALKKLKVFKLFNILKEVYSQFFEKKNTAFSKSVICYPYGRENAGFSGLISDEWEIDGVLFYTVFIPTAPNPTSGLLMHLSESNVDVLSAVTNDEMMRSIIGCGIGTGDILNKAKIVI